MEVPLPVPGAGEGLVRNHFFLVSAALRTVIGGGLEDAPFPAVLPGDRCSAGSIWAPSSWSCRTDGVRTAY